MEVNTDNKAIKSMVVKGGSRTYFIDVAVSKKGEKYLKICESKFSGENQPRQRNHILLFKSSIDQFKEAFDELADFTKAD